MAAAAVGYWGFASSESIPVSVILAIVGGGLVAVVWGGFVAPKAPRRLHDPGRLVLELVIFGAASLGLAIAGSAVLGIVLAVAVCANLSLMFALGQRGL